MWEDSFPARLYRAFWKQGNAGGVEKPGEPREEDKSHGAYFRFDMEYDGIQPALDDVTSMPHVAQIGRDSVW